MRLEFSWLDPLFSCFPWSMLTMAAALMRRNLKVVSITAVVVAPSSFSSVSQQTFVDTLQYELDLLLGITHPDVSSSTITLIPPAPEVASNPKPAVSLYFPGP